MSYGLNLSSKGGDLDFWLKDSWSSFVASIRVAHRSHRSSAQSMFYVPSAQRSLNPSKLKERSRIVPLNSYICVLLGSTLDLTAIAIVKCQHAEGCGVPLKSHVTNYN